MRVGGRATFWGLGVLLWVLLGASTGLAQKYGADDPLPPGANGKVEPMQGKVVEIKGLALAVAGKTDSLSAALKDLSAKTTQTEIRIELASDVLFDFDKFSLRPQATDTLTKVGQVVKGYPNAPLLIEGYTDGKGGHDYNIKLSENRALSVKNWLAQNAGIQGSRITTRGLGEAKPVAPNTSPNGSDNPDGRQKNRRVELTLTTR